MSKRRQAIKLTDKQAPRSLPTAMANTDAAALYCSWGKKNRNEFSWLAYSIAWSAATSAVSVSFVGWPPPMALGQDNRLSRPCNGAALGLAVHRTLTQTNLWRLFDGGQKDRTQAARVEAKEESLETH